jgi:hypothetical protein
LGDLAECGEVLNMTRRNTKGNHFQEERARFETRICLHDKRGQLSGASAYTVKVNLIWLLQIIIIIIHVGCSLSPQHGASSGCGWRNGLQLWRLAANILNKQSRTNDKGLALQLRDWAWG